MQIQAKRDFGKLHAVTYTTAFWLLLGSFSALYALFIMRVEIRIPEPAPVVRDIADAGRVADAEMDYRDSFKPSKRKGQ